MTTPRPLALSLKPAAQRYHAKPVHVRVTDIGSARLHVATSTVLLHDHCRATPAVAVRVSPAQFTLHPGQTQVVTVDAPQGGAAADYGVVFSGSVPAGTDALAAGVGSQLLVGKNTVSCVPPRVAAARPVQGGISVPEAGIAGGFLVVIVVLAVIARLSRHRPQARGRHA